MPKNLNIVDYLDFSIKEIASRFTLFDSAFDPQIRLANPNFGDFQINGILPLAKRLGQNPKELAKPLIHALSKKPVLKAIIFLSKEQVSSILNFP